jgi:protein TonB
MTIAALIGLGFVALVIGAIQLFKYIINSSGKKILASGVQNDGLTKKYYDVDIDKYSSLLWVVGLTISLGAILTAFEWKTYDEIAIVDMGAQDAVVEEVIEIPQTQQSVPPPPKIVQPEIVEIPDEEELEDVDVDMNAEVNQETVVEAPKPVVVAKEEVVEEEKTEEIFTIVEEGAEPDGGYDAFYKYVGKQLKYPAQARRMGVEGKVYVQFVVDKDGSITDVKSMKGIGAGCDEEAVRVIQGAPKWKPGKQRGRPVKQRIVMPINFKLG